MNKEEKRNPIQSIGDFLFKYNLVIFIVIIVVGLSVAVLDLSYILQLPYNTTDSITESSSTINFDQTTISNIEKLKSSNENNSVPALPSGRNNPFSE